MDSSLNGKEVNGVVNGFEFAPDEDRVPVHIANGPIGFEAICDAIPQAFQVNGYDIADQTPADMTPGFGIFNESYVYGR
jgi:hypothetical protein